MWVKTLRRLEYCRAGLQRDNTTHLVTFFLLFPFSLDLFQLNFLFSLPFFNFPLIFMWCVCHLLQEKVQLSKLQLQCLCIKHTDLNVCYLCVSVSGTQACHSTFVLETFFPLSVCILFGFSLSSVCFCFSATGTENSTCLTSVKKLNTVFLQSRVKFCLRATAEALCGGRALALSGSEGLLAGAWEHYLVISARWHRQLCMST